MFKDKHPKDSRRHFFSTVGVSAYPCTSQYFLFNSTIILIFLFSFCFFGFCFMRHFGQDYLMNHEWNQTFLHDTCRRCFTLANGCFKFIASDYVSSTSVHLSWIWYFPFGIFFTISFFPILHVAFLPNSTWRPLVLVHCRSTWWLLYLPRLILPWRWTVPTEC